MAAVNKLEVLAKEHGKTPLEFLAGEFYKHGSQLEMAKALKVSPSTVRHWILSLGLIEKPALFLVNTGIQLSEKGKQMVRNRS